MGTLFERIHVSLTRLLVTQKNKEDPRCALRLITAVLEDGYSSESISDDEKAAARCAVIAALKVALDQVIAAKNYDSLVVEYSQLITVLFSFHETTEVTKLKWPYVKTILTSLLMFVDVSQSNLNLKETMTALDTLLEFVETDASIIKELTDVHFIHIYGKLFHSLLHILRNSDAELSTRLRCTSLLSRLVSLSPPGVLSSVLPGLLSLLATLITTSLPPSQITTDALKVFFDALIKCIGDEEWEQCVVTPDPSHTAMNTDIASEKGDDYLQKLKSLMVCRDKEWMQRTAVQTTELMKPMIAACCASHHESVRLCTIECLSKSSNFKKTFEKSLHNTILDSLLLLSRDVSTEVRASAASLLKQFRIDNPTEYSFLIHDRLSTTVASLSTSLQRSADCERIFNQLSAVVCVAPKRVVMLDGSIQRLLIAVSNVIRIDRRKLIISSLRKDLSLRELLNQLPFAHGIKVNYLTDLAKELSLYDCSEILLIFRDLLFELCNEDRSAVLILLCLVIQHFTREQLNDACDVVQSISESLIEYLNELKLEDVQSIARDSVVEDLSRGHSVSSCATLSLLCALGLTIGAIANERSQNLLLVNSLCVLLQWTSVHNFVVSAAARAALLEIAECQDISLSELLSSKAILIVNKMSSHCRQFIRNPQCPLVLEMFLQNVDDVNSYSHVKNLVQQLLVALDTHHQEWTILILRVMNSFLNAIVRWYGEIKPVVEEGELDEKGPVDTVDQGEGPSSDNMDETDVYPAEKPKPPLPEQVTMTENILLRTRHLLSSPHSPVRLLVLHVLSSALKVVKNFDDILLPMVHQNWSSLKFRIRDDDITVRIQAVKTLETVCEVAGSFVYRRVREEVWREMAKWAREQTKRVLYSQSHDYRLLAAIVKSTSVVWSSIGFDDQDAPLVWPLLEDCINSPHVSLDIKRSAEECRRNLEKYLSESGKPGVSEADGLNSNNL